MNIQSFNPMLYIAGFPYSILAVFILALSLLLIFEGRKFAKSLTFLVSGAAVASIGAIIGASVMDAAGAFIGTVIGFAIGGFLGVMLIPAGMGLALGYVSYSLSQNLLGNLDVSLVVAAIFFLAGIMLADKLLAGVSAVLGGMLLFDFGLSYGAGVVFGAVAAIVISAFGLWYQTRTTRATEKATPMVSPMIS